MASDHPPAAPPPDDFTSGLAASLPAGGGMPRPPSAQMPAGGGASAPPYGHDAAYGAPPNSAGYGGYPAGAYASFAPAPGAHPQHPPLPPHAQHAPGSALSMGHHHVPGSGLPPGVVPGSAPPSVHHHGVPAGAVPGAMSAPVQYAYPQQGYAQPAPVHSPSGSAAGYGYAGPEHGLLATQGSMGSSVPGQPVVYTHASIVSGYGGGYAQGGGGQFQSVASGTTGVGAGGPLSNVPATEVKLEISAEKLRDRDIVSKSDPVAVVFEEVRNQFAPAGSADEQRWREVGRTESIKDDLNPHFKQHVTVPYRFEELQNIRIGLWDIDSKNPALTNHDFLGDVRTTLGDMVAAGSWTGKLTYPRASDNKKLLGGVRELGEVTVQVHEDSKSDKIAINFELSAVKLDRKDFFGKSDPYVVITQLKGQRNTSRKQLYKTEVIPRTLNPTWKPVRLLVDAPKGGTKKDIRIEFQVVDKDQRGRDDEIGVIITTLDEMESSPKLTIVNSKNRARGKKKSSGTLVLGHCNALVLPTMIQYLQGGLNLHFTVAVDLTASNGHPRNPASLHFMDPVTRSNQYTKALVAVAQIITVYTPNDRVAAFGFGADIDNSGSASHCFPLNLQADPHCHGLEGIFAAYGHALSCVDLLGPTNFTPLLEASMQLSQQREHSQAHQNFDVVLILTDGVVSDFARTIDKIIEASYTSALSIIIIGVGSADFKKMEIIDGDDRRLTSSNGLKQVKRDIVQFVPFRDYEHGPPDRLAAAVLGELPMQCVNYFTTLDPPVLPNPPQVSQY